MTSESIVQVRGLSTAYGHRAHEVPVLRDITFDVQAGSALGIAGETGSGKSTLALALLGALRAGGRITAGQVLFDDHDVFALDDRARRIMRSQRIGFVPQSPAASLTATMRVSAFLAESRAHAHGVTRADAAEETSALFEELRLPEPEVLLSRHPYELSGGQQQRVALAIALLNKPDLLILDEPTTGLDAATKRQAVDMIQRIRREHNLTMVCVSHDLSLLTSLCDDLAVMYAGRVVEVVSAISPASTARHPYTRALAAAQPKLTQVALPAGIPGSPPALGDTADGCAFSPRCLHASDECGQVLPRRTNANVNGFVHCHHPQSGETGAEVVQELSTLELRQDGALLLDAQNVEMSYGDPHTRSSAGRPHHVALDSVSFAVREAEIVAIVGESGSGKSTLARILAGVQPGATGQLAFEGAPLPTQVRSRTRPQRRAVQLVLQHPDTALNPRYSLDRLLRRCLRHATSDSFQDRRERVSELLELVELPAHLANHLPGQLSGGQKQRVNLACALAASPRLLICDEVTSALDVSVQASVLRLLHTIVKRTGLSIILITHDLPAARLISDRIVVLREGRVVEHGDVDTVINHPADEYTAELIECMRI